MNKTLTLPADVAIELAWLPPGARLEFEGRSFTVMATTEDDHSRWSSLHTLVVADEAGRLWGSDFRQGLTESQHESPWEYDDVAEFSLYQAELVTTVMYRPMAAKAA
ncbi:hypothetical protein [Sinosporangium album]|uniref:hypothetical protein n=1 Tax=Sinosporangium album TaxID=504805 RepID=UPI00115FD9A9|nr:hypothetical protein [Sinosporangium album]